MEERTAPFSKIVFILSLAAVIFSPASFAQLSPTLYDIEVIGAQRTEEGTVKSYLDIRVGDIITEEKINNSLKQLFATGLFTDVTIERHGNVLVVNLIENPTVNTISFEGNKKISDDILKRETILSSRVIYTQARLQRDIERILSLYQRSGYQSVSVIPHTASLDHNRIDLTFEIDEGKRTGISSIRFIGNEVFSDRRLRNIIRTSESRWYKFFSSTDIYDVDQVRYDEELLRRYYLRKGYLDFQSISAIGELSPDQGSFYLTYSVSEGVRYKVASVSTDIELKNLDESAIFSAISHIKVNKWYDDREIERAVTELVKRLDVLNYQFYEVTPYLRRDPANQTVDITFSFQEGSPVFVERIDIVGNVRTQDNVLRRIFTFAEGDAYQREKVALSKRKLEGMDYFKSVAVDVTPGSSPDRVVIKTSVAEKSTGSLMIGAGYSSLDGFIAEASLRERNFLGTGYEAYTTFRAAESNSSFSAGIVSPWFLDRNVRVGMDGFYINESYDSSSYTERKVGGSLHATYLLTPSISQGWRYTLYENNIQSFDTNTSPLIVDNEERDRVFSAVAHTLSWRTTDSVRRPTEGHFITLVTELAGIGGNAKYVSNILSMAKYFEVTDNTVFSLSGRTGYITGINNTDTSIRDRFFLGGSSLRGFSYAGIGPRDSITDDSLGGEWMYKATAQLDFPLSATKNLGIGGRIFADFGSIGQVPYDSPERIHDSGSIRASVGMGLTWDSPMGPIGIDYGYPIQKENYDRTERLFISFGTFF